MSKFLLIILASAFLSILISTAALVATREPCWIQLKQPRGVKLDNRAINRTQNTDQLTSTSSSKGCRSVRPFPKKNKKKQKQKWIALAATNQQHKTRRVLRPFLQEANFVGDAHVTF